MLRLLFSISEVAVFNSKLFDICTSVSVHCFCSGCLYTSAELRGSCSLEVHFPSSDFFFLLWLVSFLMLGVLCLSSRACRLIICFKLVCEIINLPWAVVVLYRKWQTVCGSMIDINKYCCKRTLKAGNRTPQSFFFELIYT